MSIRPSRRNFLRSSGIATAGVSSYLAVGCGDDDDENSAPTAATGGTASTSTSSSPTAQEDGVRGGKLTIPRQGNFTEVLDPHTAQNNAAFFYAYIGNQLLRPSADASELLPELLESWEIPGDGTEIVLKVREGMTWHNKPPVNGRAITAEDIAYNINRIAGKFHPDEIARFQRRSTVPNLDSATASDANTVVIKLTRPHSGFLAGLGDWRNNIAPKEMLEGNLFEAAQLVGSGPFMMDSFDNGVSAKLVRNPDYWEENRPYVDEIEWLFFADAVSSVAAMSQGQLDWRPGGSQTDQKTLKALGNKARELIWAHGTAHHLAFNHTRPQLADKRVRQALSLVIDYKAAGDGYYGEGLWDWSGPISQGFAEAMRPDTAMKLPFYDPAAKDKAITEAKALMSAAGFPEGELTLDIFPFSKGSNWEDAAIRVLDDFKKVWPKLNGQVSPPADAAASVRRQGSGEYDIQSSGSSPFPDIAIQSEAFFHSNGSRNYRKFSDPGLDKSVEAIAAELDTDERKKLVGELEKQVLDLVPLTVLYSPRVVMYVAQRVKGVGDYGSRLGGGADYDTASAAKNFWVNG